MENEKNIPLIARVLTYMNTIEVPDEKGFVFLKDDKVEG